MKRQGIEGFTFDSKAEEWAHWAKSCLRHQPKPWTVERVKDTPVGLVRVGIACGAISREMADLAFPDGLPAVDGISATTCDEHTPETPHE